jgi:hypothetical protein
VHHVKNQHVHAINAVDDDILAYGKASQAGAQIVAEATYIGMIAKKKETVGNGISQAISDLYAATVWLCRTKYHQARPRPAGQAGEPSAWGLLLGIEPKASALFHFVSKFTHRLLRDSTAFTS